MPVISSSPPPSRLTLERRPPQAPATTAVVVRPLTPEQPRAWEQVISTVPEASWNQWLGRYLDLYG